MQYSYLCTSAPKGRQQMGETGFCENLRFPAKICSFLRRSATRIPNLLIYRASRKSAKICKNLRECAFRVRFLPFAVSLLARPDFGCDWTQIPTRILAENRQGPTGVPTKGCPWSGRFLRTSEAKNLTELLFLKCRKDEEIWPFHGYPFCASPFLGNASLFTKCVVHNFCAP